MKISIIVPAFNEEKVLPKSLPAIRSAAMAFDKRGWEWELVVCDNNSTDHTARIAREAGATVIFEPVNQISRARNRGASAARGEWLLFIDADSYPSQALFESLVAKISNTRCIGGGCILQLDEQLPIANAITRFWNFISQANRWAAGSFVFCDAHTFRKLGGFSEKLFASEEIEFSKRLKSEARILNKTVEIIADQALVTSARKIHLYKKSEHARFFLKAMLRPWHVLSNREQCQPWYDGRR